mmetsp:Transcript_97915/g.238208  ORF Transcript_97915/g.238208 Transcript_97915/m.238208 type:complete len:246 (+) Transcript_97915:298-1035(+)
MMAGIQPPRASLKYSTCVPTACLAPIVRLPPPTACMPPATLRLAPPIALPNSEREIMPSWFRSITSKRSAPATIETAGAVAWYIVVIGSWIATLGAACTTVCVCRAIGGRTAVDVIGSETICCITGCCTTTSFCAAMSCGSCFSLDSTCTTLSLYSMVIFGTSFTTCCTDGSGTCRMASATCTCGTSTITSCVSVVGTSTTFSTRCTWGTSTILSTVCISTLGTCRTTSWVSILGTCLTTSWIWT